MLQLDFSAIGSTSLAIMLEVLRRNRDNSLGEPDGQSSR